MSLTHAEHPAPTEILHSQPPSIEASKMGKVRNAFLAVEKTQQQFDERIAQYE
jgi:hypothetical protein